MQMRQDVSTRNLEEFADVFADISNVNLYDGEQVILPEQLELYQQMKAEVKKKLERGEKINMCYFVEMMENKAMDALNTLIERLMADGRSEELLQSTQDRELQKKLMMEYGIRELDG